MERRMAELGAERTGGARADCVNGAAHGTVRRFRAAILPEMTEPRPPPPDRRAATRRRPAPPSRRGRTRPPRRAAWLTPRNYLWIVGAALVVCCRRCTGSARC